MIKLHVTCASLLITLSAAGLAQTMYRCGNAYSDQPCGPDTKVLNRPPAVSMPPPDTPALPGVEKRAFEQCRSAVLQILKDPESARFGFAYRGKLARVVYEKTGEVVYLRDYTIRVNAKNSYGGYTGDKRFVCRFNADESALVWSGPID